MPQKAQKKIKDQDMTFYMENVRCFGTGQKLNIRPLTFLVGENSTGKTTLLSCFDVMTSMIYPFFEHHMDFNKPPYNMGSFENIIKKTSKGSHKEFHIGFSLKQPRLSLKICFKEDKKQSEPMVKYFSIEHQNNKWHCDYDNKKMIYQIDSQSERRLILPDNLWKNIQSLPIDFLFRVPFRVLLSRSFRSSKVKNENLKKNISVTWDRAVRNFLGDLRDHLRRAVSLAPVRSKPQRTYDPIKEMPDASGKEVPMYLMRLKTTDKKKWKDLKKNLIHFGKTSGLFTDIDVKKYGESMGDPFQLQFKIRGVQSNIMDVGYGVSQILPLLMRFFVHQNPRRFLLQQPEVHLHPKAQAEMASLLVKCVTDYNHAFLIETHSDYMVDRVRIEIQKGNIPSSQVSLIYLEAKENGDVQAHNVSFDAEGNVLNAPETYRQFFIKEMNQTMGLKT